MAAPLLAAPTHPPHSHWLRVVVRHGHAARGALPITSPNPGCRQPAPGAPPHCPFPPGAPPSLSLPSGCCPRRGCFPAAHPRRRSRPPALCQGQAPAQSRWQFSTPRAPLGAAPLTGSMCRWPAPAVTGMMQHSPGKAAAAPCPCVQRGHHPAATCLSPVNNTAQIALGALDKRGLGSVWGCRCCCLLPAAAGSLISAPQPGAAYQGLPACPCCCQ